MIVFPCSSQKNYVIGKDTIVGYTKLENRKIAIVFQDRNKLEELNFDNELLITELDKSKRLLEINAKAYATKDSVYNQRICIINEDLNKQIKSVNTWKKVGFIATCIIVIETFILAIK